MASHLLIQCSCHAGKVEAKCPLWHDSDSKGLFRSRSLNTSGEFEVETTTLENLIALEINCEVCKEQAKECIQKLYENPNSSIPVAFRESWDLHESIFWRISAGSVGTTLKIRIANNLSNNDAQEFDISGSVSTEHIYKFLYKQSSGGSILDPVDYDVRLGDGSEVITSYIRYLKDLCAKCASKDDELLLKMAKEIDCSFEALSIGYNFLRLFHPETMRMDLIWVLNNHRQDQADFFISAADYLSVCKTEAEFKLAISELKAMIHDCFTKSLRVFEPPESLEALRYGIRLFNSENFNSFIYRKQQSALFPLVTFTKYFTRIAFEDKNVYTRSIAESVVQLVQEFVEADSWANLQASSDILSPFCAGLDIKGLTEDMFQLQLKSFNEKVDRSKISGWFGIELIPPVPLEEAAQRFFENRFGQYRSNTHEFLLGFLESTKSVLKNRNQLNVWSISKNMIDAIFSVKIGNFAYGELDWVLSKFNQTRYCTITSPHRVNHCFSHVVAKYLLSEEYQQLRRGKQSPVRRIIANLIGSPSEYTYNRSRSFSDGGSVVQSMLNVFMEEDDANFADQSDTSNSSILGESRSIEGKEEESNYSTSKSTIPFEEEWTHPTCCFVRIPAIYYSFVNEGTILHDVAVQSSTTIEVHQTGKILVAPCAIRISSKRSEAIRTAVALLRNSLHDLELVERNFLIPKSSVSKIVGKNGERTSLRLASNCKIFISDVKAPVGKSWIVLLGKENNVIEAHKMIRHNLGNDEKVVIPMLPLRRGRSNSPIANHSRLAMKKNSSDEIDDGLGRRVRPNLVRVSISSEPGSEQEDQEDRRKCDSLFKAVQHRDWVLASELVEKNEGIHFVAASGTTVLHKAAERNAPDSILNSLIAKGLDPNKAVLRKGFTPVHFAVQSNSKPRLLEILINAGADVNREDDQKQTPAHLGALRNVTPSLMKILIEAGADLRQKDKAGYTPLQLAISSGASVELISLMKHASI